MPLPPHELLARAARLREKAALLHDEGRTKKDPTIRDAYTVLVSEYDTMAIQLERLAQET